MDPWLIALIAVQASFISVLIWIVVHYRTAKARQRTEERLRLLDRFESAADLERFLATNAGRAYLTASHAFRIEPRIGVILAFGAGMVSFVIGIGCLLLAATGSGSKDMATPGMILTSLGIGLFLAAGISWFLIRLWRLGRDERA